MALDKLVDSTQLDTDLTSVANAIRAKSGGSGTMAFPSGFVSAIQNIPTGGGGTTDGDVIFIDYDGTVVDAKTKAEINAMTSDSDLPANPSHTGLTAQGWNWTVAQLKAQLTAMPDQKVYVGQMYVTTSGATEIDVEMHEGRLSPILTVAVNGTISVDWGDNTTPDTVTGTSLTTQLEVGPHNYTASGNYTIKISVSTGQFSFYGSSTYLLLRKNNSVSENRVYANCIKRVRLGTGIERIGSSAFYYCHSLSSITIPNSVTTIDNNVFYGCYSLSSITIPSDVTIIGVSIFSNCYALSDITIPSGVTTISNSSFSNCNSLSKITIPSSVTTIGGIAFYYCYSLSSITIPNGVTRIDASTFYGCYSLSKITIPSSVTTISSNAFGNCYALSSITIPSGVTTISGSIFSGCYSLPDITIPSGVTTISSTAFCYCYSFSSVTIPDSVTSIGNSAFQNCSGVSEIHILPEIVPTLGRTVFNNIPSDCIIYVPYSADHSILNAYKTASNWSAYASYMQEEPQ